MTHPKLPEETAFSPQGVAGGWDSTPADELADKLQNLLSKDDDLFVGQMMRHYGDIFVAALRQPPSDAIRLAVIEECAKVADDLGGVRGPHDAVSPANKAQHTRAKTIAKAIRALAQDNHIKGQDNAG